MTDHLNHSNLHRVSFWYLPAVGKERGSGGKEQEVRRQETATEGRKQKRAADWEEGDREEKDV
ncbi:conserved hypothetical protein [Ricinus communis]|uniref:Uncharacterized protein n=1 Tax=Ricinus communis TaxID=3988 RepID=B9SYE6_RICCO|nr:conserved hypothetical protein [Ricinus communis]